MKSNENNQRPNKFVSFYLKPIQQKKLTLKILIFILPVLLFPLFYKLALISSLSSFFKELESFSTKQGPGAWWLYLFFFSLIFIISYIITFYLILFHNLMTSYKRKDIALGEVIDSELESYEDDVMMYKPVITYKFEAGNSSRTNTFFLRDGWTSDKEGEEESLKKYPLGERVIVYYDRRNVDNNSIKKFTSWNVLIFILKILLATIFFISLSLACGTLLSLFIDTLIYNSILLKILSGLIFLYIIISFFPHTIWFYETEFDE